MRRHCLPSPRIDPAGFSLGPAPAADRATASPSPDEADRAAAATAAKRDAAPEKPGAAKADTLAR
ncbi:hypothetical protein GCM10022630_23020 [Thermobifida alba]